MFYAEIQALGAYLLRVATGFVTKKDAGKFDFKKAGKTLIFAVIAYGIGRIANIPPESAMNLPIFYGITHILEKWYNAIVMKVKDKHFKFFE